MERKPPYITLENNIVKGCGENINFTDIETITIDIKKDNNEYLQVLVCYFNIEATMKLYPDDNRDTKISKSTYWINFPIHIDYLKDVNDNLRFRSGISLESSLDICKRIEEIFHSLKNGDTHGLELNRIGYSKLQSNKDLIKEIDKITYNHTCDTIDMNNLNKLKHELVYALRKYNIDVYPIIVGNCITHSCEIDFKLKDKDVSIIRPKPVEMIEDNIGYCYVDNNGLCRDFYRPKGLR